MDNDEAKVIADGFFKVLATAYKHGALEKFLYLRESAQFEAARALGVRVGDVFNATDGLTLESVQKGEAALTKLVPYLDILASDALWIAVSTMLDNQMVQRFIREASKKELTGVQVNPIKETISSIILEILQAISQSPEEKTRLARMFEVIQGLMGPKSKGALKEAV